MVTVTPEGVISDPTKTVILVDDERAPFETLTTMLAECGLRVEIWSQSINRLVADSNVNTYACIVLNANYCGEEEYFSALALSLNAPVIYFTRSGAPLVLDDSEKPFYWLPATPSIVEVKVALEVSRYKFRSRNVITNQLNMLGKAFSCVGDYLICLDFQGQITHVNAKACELFSVEEDQVVGNPWYTLIKTRQDLSARHTQQFISAAINTRAVTKVQPIALQISKKESVLVDGVIGPTNDAGNKTGVVCILRQLTSLGALPDLVSSDVHTDKIDIHRIEATGTLLFSPDQLNNINLRYGRLAGDRVLIEIDEVLKSVLRPTDLATHYGGANFLVLFSESTKAQIDNLVKILQKKLVSHKFHAGQVNLTFSFGLATNNELVNYSPIELFYYANYSLAQAQDLGGDQVRIWKQENALQQIGNFDRISGNFSETGSSDYQKMLMLWSILNNPQKITTDLEFLEFLLSHLNSGFKLLQSAFFSLNHARLTFKMGLDASCCALQESAITLSENQREYAADVCNGETTEPIFTSILGENTQVCVVIKGSKSPLGLLWLSFGSEQTFSLKSQRMLDNIAEFAAVKLEQLANAVNQQKSKNKSNSEQDKINFWYTSKEMVEQAEFIEKVAPTEATVLITGESGTGKELLAKSIHARSLRKDKPFVIFDCGAVVESLIESELFGYKRGAFTGASKDSVGCIQQAHTGTLFLDEVGELPIETQVKLLRFTQEKQFAQVGSNSYKKVDVRLVAATNVDLLERIKKGLFREDLYYRLNVFNLKSLPLRERKDDILFLSTRYLALFAKEYNKSISNFSDTAKQALYQYEWPGNVRELRNLIHKAVILCQSRTLDCTDLGLYPLYDTEVASSPSDSLHAVPSSISHDEGDNALLKPTSPNAKVTFSATEEASEQTTFWSNDGSNIANYFEAVSEPADDREEDEYKASTPDSALGVIDWAQLVRISREQGFQIAPWLERCLMHLTLANNNQIVLRAANELGIAESSFRRRWQKIQLLDVPNEPRVKVVSEQVCRQLLNTPQIMNKLDTMQKFLVKACEYLDLSVTDGARVLSVSAPTYRKMLRNINEQ